MNIRITARDLDIFAHMSKMRFLTATQTASLFFATLNGHTFDLKHAKGAAYRRLWFLQKNGFINSAPSTDHNGNNAKVYFLDGAGASVLRDLREIESCQAPNMLHRKNSHAYMHGPHDILTNNILCNMLLLSTAFKTFNLTFWLGDRDCRFNINHDRRSIFDPDLFITTSSNEDNDITLFFEVERGTNTAPVLKRKILRFFQYYSVGGHTRDLSIDLFPRSCFILNNKRDIHTLVKIIKEEKLNYSGPEHESIQHFPFWITTIEKVDPFCLEDGRISTNILGNIWTTHTGDNNATPFE